MTHTDQSQRCGWLDGVPSRPALLIAGALLVAACADDRAASPRPPVPEAASSAVPAGAVTRIARPDPVEVSARLQAVVDTFAAGQAVPFSIVAVDVATGARAAHLGERQVPSASLYKLYVARELLRRIYAGTLSRDAGAGDGSGRSVGECLRAMIVVSDNACGEAGLRTVGRGALDAGLRRDGFVSTSLSAPERTSADDVALLLERARDGTLLGPGSQAESAELYGLLRAQEVDDRLPRGLPAGVTIAHKTGDRRQWAHDAGVITTRRGDVVLAVLSGPWPLPCCDADHPGEPERVAFGAIAALGHVIYDATSQ